MATALACTARRSAGRCVTMFDLIDAILILGFPVGVVVGYRWRDRISRERRARYLAERGKTGTLTAR